ncbi:MAG: carbohydrate-binding protein [Bacteroidia bacterium]|nr:carbohydrate-binding protein [Bacteroidia bacterium]
MNDPEFYQTGYGYSFGVGQYNAEWPKIQAEWYFASQGVEKSENTTGGFEIQQIHQGDWLKFPKVKNLKPYSSIHFSVASNTTKGGIIEVRENDRNGKLLGKCTIKSTKSWKKYATVGCKLQNDAASKDICLVFKGDKNELMRLDWFAFNVSPKQ